MTAQTTTHEERERDRIERDHPTHQRSLLAFDLCQMCGFEPHTGGTIPRYDGDNVRHEELCPYCNYEEVE